MKTAFVFVSHTLRVWFVCKQILRTQFLLLRTCSSRSEANEAAKIYFWPLGGVQCDCANKNRRLTAKSNNWKHLSGKRQCVQTSKPSQIEIDSHTKTGYEGKIETAGPKFADTHSKNYKISLFGDPHIHSIQRRPVGSQLPHLKI